jgi:hypothetical protein
MAVDGKIFSKNVNELPQQRLFPIICHFAFFGQEQKIFLLYLIT